jgi:hypothetical protein
MPVLSTREHAIKTLEALPADADFDSILKEIAFERMINKGLQDSLHGRTISSEKLRSEIQSWFK